MSNLPVNTATWEEPSFLVLQRVPSHQQSPCPFCTPILTSGYFISSSQRPFKESESLRGMRRIRKAWKILLLSQSQDATESAGILLKRQRSQLERKGHPSGQVVTTRISQSTSRSTVAGLQVSSMKSHESLMNKKEKWMLYVQKDTYSCVITMLVVIQRVKTGYFSE